MENEPEIACTDLMGNETKAVFKTFLMENGPKITKNISNEKRTGNCFKKI